MLQLTTIMGAYMLYADMGTYMLMIPRCDAVLMGCVWTLNKALDAARGIGQLPYLLIYEDMMNPLTQHRIDRQLSDLLGLPAGE